jgi:4-diphosphocytidyl-2C-methyl-D-erythritol kinase
VSTKDAYQWFDEGHPGIAGRTGRPVNQLEAVVVARHPEIGGIVEQLKRARASQAAMSGSGSAVFGLFVRRPNAEAAADALIGGGGRIIVTRTLSGREYQRLSRPVLARK